MEGPKPIDRAVAGCYVRAIMYDDQTATLLKKLFAAAWLRQPDNPYAAAREVEQHPGLAVWISQNWLEDETVLAEKTRLLAVMGPLVSVPTKEQFAAEVYAKKCKDDATQLRYYEFFAKLMGYVDDKSGNGGVNVNILNQQKFMAVPAFSSEEEWQRIATTHSKELQARHG